MTQTDMMREVVQYALEEMRNRGLEDAAMLAEQSSDPYLARDIRALKRDPSAQMTDWWAKRPMIEGALK
jgi:hypothetical protein